MRSRSSLYRQYQSILEAEGLDGDLGGDLSLSDRANFSDRITFFIETGVVSDPGNVEALRAVNFGFQQLGDVDGTLYGEAALDERTRGATALDPDAVLAAAQNRLEAYETQLADVSAEFDTQAGAYLTQQGVDSSDLTDRAGLIGALEIATTDILSVDTLDVDGLAAFSNGLSLIEIGNNLEALDTAGTSNMLTNELADIGGETDPSVLASRFSDLGGDGLAFAAPAPGATVELSVASPATLQLAIELNGARKSTTIDLSEGDVRAQIDSTLDYIRSNLDDAVFRQLPDEFSINAEGRVDKVLRTAERAGDLALIEGTDAALAGGNIEDIESLQGRLINQEYLRTYTELLTGDQRLTARQAGEAILDSVDRAGLGEVADIYRSLLNGDDATINRYLDGFDNPSTLTLDPDSPVIRAVADNQDLQQSLADRINAFGVDGEEGGFFGSATLDADPGRVLGVGGSPTFVDSKGLIAGVGEDFRAGRNLAGDLFSTGFSAFGAASAGFGLYGGLNTLLNPNAGGVRAVGAVTVASSSFALYNSFTTAAFDVASNFTNVARAPALAAVNPTAFTSVVEAAGGTVSTTTKAVGRAIPIVGSIVSVGLGIYSLQENARAADQARQDGDTTRAALLGISAALDAVDLVLEVVSLVGDFLPPIGTIVSTVADVIGVIVGAISTVISFFIPPPGVESQFRDFLGSDGFAEQLDEIAADFAEQGFDLLQYSIDAATAGIDGPRDRLLAARRDLERALSEAAEADPDGQSLRLAIIDNTSVGNVLEGRDGDDFINGGAGDDEIFGRGGDDQLFGGEGDDRIEGGEGDDYVNGGSGDDFILGGAGDDTLIGGIGADFIDGGTGDDILVGGIDNDTLIGGLGDDQLSGGRGADDLSGGEGDDLLDAGVGNDILDGGAGNDVLLLGSGDDIANAGTGSDRIQTILGINVIDGDDGGVSDPTDRDTLDLRENVRLQFPPGVDGPIALLSPGYTVDLSEGEVTNNLENLAQAPGSAPDALTDDLDNDQGLLHRLYKAFDDQDEPISVFGDTPAVDVRQSVSDDAGTAFSNAFDPTSPLAFVVFDKDAPIELEQGVLDEIEERTQRAIDRDISTLSRDEIRDQYKLGHTLAIEEVRDRHALGYSQRETGVTAVRQAYDAFIASAISAGRQAVFIADIQIARSISTDDGLRQSQPSLTRTLREFDNPDDPDNPLILSVLEPPSRLEEALLSDRINARAFTDGTAIILVTEDSGEFYRFDVSDLREAQNASKASGNDITINDFYLLTVDVLNAQAEFTGIEDVSGGFGDDVLTGDDETNALFGQYGDDVLNGADGDDLISGGQGDDVIDGGAGNDNILLGAGGFDQVDGGDDIDTVSFLQEGNVGVVASTSGIIRDAGSNPEPADRLSTFTNIENLEGTRFIDQLVGDEQTNQLAGNAGNDDLYGLRGDDVLIGGAGADRLFGGADSDTASYVDRRAIVGPDGEIVDDSRASGVTANLSTGENTEGDIYDSIENLSGTEFGDDLTGDGNVNALNGGGGADSLSGLGGDDLLIGGAGADTLDGGGGSDTVSYNDGRNSGVTVRLIGDENSDGDTYTSIENVVGTNQADDIRGDSKANVLTGLDGEDRLQGNGGNDILLGNDGADLLFGNDGDDFLIGGDGDDSLRGGDGNDVLIGGEGDDDLRGGEGFDTASYAQEDAGVTVDLATGQGPGLETLRDIENVIGSGFADTLTGDAGANLIIGGAGADALDGGEGVDTVAFNDGRNEGVTVDLSAGTSSDGDTLSGFENVIGTASDDTITGDAGDNVLIGGGGADVLAGGDGVDTASYADETDAVEINLTTTVNNQNDVLVDIESLVGGSADDVLTGDGASNSFVGGRGNDTLRGLSGSDVLFGGEGNDTLRGDAGDDVLAGGAGVDRLDGGDGSDTASFAREADAVAVDLANGSASTGDTLVSVENVEGTTGDDTLSGDDGANALYGLAGEDDLFGRAGDDRLFGGGGNDFIVGGDGNDLISGGEGSDVIRGGAGVDGVTYEVNSAGVTVDLAVGTASDGDVLSSIENVIGSEFADEVTGTDATNVLTGLGGDDILDGRGGDDTLRGNAGDDTVKGGDGADVLIGGEGDDRLEGEAGDDLLRADGGTDTLIGGAGSDVYVVGAASRETVIEAGDGVDRLAFSETSASTVSLALIEVTGDRFLTFSAAVPNTDDPEAAPQIVELARVSLASLFADGVDLAALGHQAIAARVADAFDRLVFGDGQVAAGALAVLVLDGLAGRPLRVDPIGTVQGGDGDDTIVGADNRDDVLSGGAGADDLQGGDGSDTLIGGEGADTLDGGDGARDTASYVSSATGVDVNLQRSGAQTGGDADGDVLTNIENLQGSDRDDVLGGDASNNAIQGGAGNDNIRGRDGDDFLNGQAGNDTVRGGAGADILVADLGDDALRGGAGDDVYLVQSTAGNVRIIELEADGVDGVARNEIVFTDVDYRDVTVRRIDDHAVFEFEGAVLAQINGWFAETGATSGLYSALQFANGTRFEDPTLFVDQHISGLFSQSRLTIAGTEQGDRILAPDSSGRIATLGGNDVVIGGRGPDIIDTGEDADNVTGGGGNDDITLGGGDDVFVDAEGDETGSGRDTVRGGDGNDAILSVDGADDLYGEAGDDLFVVNNFDFQDIDGGEGTDTLSLARLVTPEAAADRPDDFYVNVNLGDVRLSGIDPETGTLYVTEEEFDELIQAGAVSGGLEGLYVDVDGNFISILNPNSGQSTVRIRDDADNSFVGSSLRIDSIENVVGSAISDRLTGNRLDNTLSGGAGDDRLRGEEGNDVLEGGLGDDDLQGGDGEDTLIADGGTDSLRGGTGADTYVISRASRDSSISEFSNLSDTSGNILSFSDLRADEVRFVRAGSSIGIVADGIRIATIDRILDVTGAPGDQFAEIRFADGTLITGVEDVQRYLSEELAGQRGFIDLRLGGDEADYIEADDGDNVINGLGGNDEILGLGWQRSAPGRQRRRHSGRRRRRRSPLWRRCRRSSDRDRRNRYRRWRVG